MDWVKQVLKVKENGRKLLKNYKQNKSEYKHLYTRVASIVLLIVISYILFRLVHYIQMPAVRFGTDQIINVVMMSAEAMLIISLIYFLVNKTVSSNLFIAESVVLALAVEFMLGTFSLLSMHDLRKELIIDQSLNNLDVINRIMTIQLTLVVVFFILLLVLANSLIHKYRNAFLNKV